MIENMGVEVGIAAPSHTVEKLFPLPVSVAAILNSVDDRRREMSGKVGSVISLSSLVENVAVDVEIASLSQAVQKLLPLPFFRPPSWISSGRSGPIFSRMAPLKSPYPKMWG